MRREGRTRSNKYSGGDSHEAPDPGERDRFWVGGYVRSDGVRVSGHYRRARD